MPEARPAPFLVRFRTAVRVCLACVVGLLALSPQAEAAGRARPHPSASPRAADAGAPHGPKGAAPAANGRAAPSDAGAPTDTGAPASAASATSSGDTQASDAGSSLRAGDDASTSRAAADAGADASEAETLEIVTPEDAGSAALEPDDPLDGKDEPSAHTDSPPGPLPDDTLQLPPVSPDELPNPAVTDGPPPEAPPVAPEERTGVVIKTILGLVALLALAYVGGHPRVQRLERTLGLSQVITAGFPFVALGAIARHPAVGVLTDPVLAALGPLLRVGLGWVGFIVGFRFDAKVVQRLPMGLPTLIGARVLVAFGCIVAVASLVLLGAQGIRRETLTDPVFLRDALILGTAGSLTALTTPRLLRERGGSEASVEQVGRIVRLEELAGIVGLLVIAAYFRPQGANVSWQLPGTAWVLLTLGAGVGIGLLVYAILLTTTANQAESLVLILGSVAFASGFAGNLRLSPVVVCFMAGLLLANFPGEYKERLAETLNRLERPIYLLFLLVVGALWRADGLHGWVLMACFVAARFGGMWLGTRIGGKAEGLVLSDESRLALVASPMGALSIAIVVNAEMLYPGGSIAEIVTAILAGAIVTEVLVQLLTRNRSAPPHPVGPRDTIVIAPDSEPTPASQAGPRDARGGVP